MQPVPCTCWLCTVEKTARRSHHKVHSDRKGHYDHGLILASNNQTEFDVAYFIAKEMLVFTKMRPMCDLLEQHGVDLGTGYKNNHACATFVKYIAEKQQQSLLETLSRVKFVECTSRWLMHGQVHVQNKFFTVR